MERFLFFLLWNISSIKGESIVLVFFFPPSPWVTFWACGPMGVLTHSAHRTKQEWVHWKQHCSFILYSELHNIWCWYILKCHHSNTFLSMQSNYIFWLFCLTVKFSARAEYWQLHIVIGILLLRPQCKLNMSMLSSNQSYLISANTTRTWTWTSQRGVNPLGFFPSKFRGKRRVGEEGRASLELHGHDIHIILLKTGL